MILKVNYCSSKMNMINFLTARNKKKCVEIPKHYKPLFLILITSHKPTPRKYYVNPLRSVHQKAWKSKKRMPLNLYLTPRDLRRVAIL